MSRCILSLVFWAIVGLAAAEGAGTDVSPMYRIGISVKEVVATAEGGEKTKMVAEPTVATVENREAVFHVGGQTQVADETVRSGTQLKIKLKKSDGGKVRVTGVLEVSSFAQPSDDFVERISTEYYFARTVSLGDKISLGKRPTAEGYHIVELTCDKFEAAEAVKKRK